MIRPATSADVDAIARLEADVFGPDAWSRDLVASELALVPAARRAYVAEAGHGAGPGAAITGYAVLMAAEEVADLNRVAVAAAGRNAGVGNALLAHVLEDARRLGACRVMLEVSAENVPALTLYARHGFVEVGRRRRYYADGSDAVCLQVEVGGHDG